MLSVFITPWMNPTSIHCATSDAWRVDDPLEEREVRVRPPRPPAGGGARSRSRRAAARASGSPRAAAYWNVPTRMWLAATRASTAPGSTVSRRTSSPVATTASARVVGMPSACIASPMTYSRSIGPTAALPSPPRANGVRPEPFRCRSRRSPVRRRRPRRAAAPGRRRAAASSRRTGGRRTPGRPASAPSGTVLPTSTPRPASERRAAGSSAELGGELVVEREQPRRRRRRAPATARTGPRARGRRSRRRREERDEADREAKTYWCQADANSRGQKTRIIQRIARRDGAHLGARVAVEVGFLEQRGPRALEVERTAAQQVRRGNIVDHRRDRAGHVVGLAETNQTIVGKDLDPTACAGVPRGGSSRYVELWSSNSSRTGVVPEVQPMPLIDLPRTRLQHYAPAPDAQPDLGAFWSAHWPRRRGSRSTWNRSASPTIQ